MFHLANLNFVDVDRLSRSGRTLRSEEHTSELQSQSNLVCRLLLEKKNARELRDHREPVPARHADSAGYVDLDIRALSDGKQRDSCDPGLQIRGEPVVFEEHDVGSE